MKKIFLLILTAVVIAGVAIFSYQKSQEVKISSLESIVPDDVIYYIYAYNLSGKVNDFKETKFFQQISRSALYQVLAEPALKQIRQKLPFIFEIIEKDTALAVYSLGNTQVYGATQGGDMGDFLFLSRIDQKKNLKAKKTLSDFYLSLAAKDKTSSDYYKGIKITNYRLPKNNISIHYALVSDAVLLSNSIGIIHKSIDLIKNLNQKSILNNPGFQKIIPRVKKDALLWGYYSYKNYNQQSMLKLLSASSAIKGPAAASAAASIKNLKPIMESMNILEDSVFYLDYDSLKSGFIVKSYQAFSRSIKDDEGLFKVLYGNQKLDKSSFGIVPRNVIAYYGGSYDLGEIWKTFKKLYSTLDQVMKVSIASAPRGSQISSLPAMNTEETFRQINNFLGIDVETEFMPLLDKNFGFTFTDLDDIDVPMVGGYYSAQQTAPMPFPRLYVYLETKDSVKAEEVMEKIIKNIVTQGNQKIQEAQEKYAQKNQETQQAQTPLEKKEYFKAQSQDYRDVKITSIEMLDFPIPALKFNYCILNKYLVLSFSPDLTKKIIDAYKDKSGSLSSNTELTFAQDKIAGDYASLFFFDFKRLLNNFRTTKFFTQMQAKLPPGNLSSFSKESVDSILDALSNINSLVMIYRQSDDYTGESSWYIRIKGL